MSTFKRLYKGSGSADQTTSELLGVNIAEVQQGLHELKAALSKALTASADIKHAALKARRDADRHQRLAGAMEAEAVRYLKMLKDGLLGREEAEDRASAALEKKKEHDTEFQLAAKEADRLDASIAEFDSQADKIKSRVKQYETELLTLKARSRSAAAAQRINEITTRLDPEATLTMLEQMTARVEAEEALAEVYGEMARADRRVDDEINAALQQDPAKPTEDPLNKLKKDMGLE